MTDAELRLRIAVDPLVPMGAVKVLAEECVRPKVPTSLILESSILKGNYAALIRGDIDLALAPCPHDDRRVAAIPVKSVTLIGAAKHRVTRASLRSIPQILVFDKHADEPPDDLLPHAVHEGGGPKIFVATHAMKVSLMHAGIGWGRIAREELKSLKAIPPSLSPHVPLELCALRAKKRPLGPWVVRSGNGSSGDSDDQSQDASFECFVTSPRRPSVTVIGNA